MSKNVIEIYFKGNKKKTAEVKLKSKDDVRDIITLCKGELFRRSFLSDIDYEDTGALSFKVCGDKVSCKKLLQSCQNALNAANDDNDDDDRKKDTKKHKKDKKKDKKKNKHHEDSLNKYPKFGREPHVTAVSNNDSCVTLHRVKKEYYYN